VAELKGVRYLYKKYKFALENVDKTMSIDVKLLVWI